METMLESISKIRRAQLQISRELAHLKALPGLDNPHFAGTTIHVSDTVRGVGIFVVSLDKTPKYNIITVKDVVVRGVTQTEKRVFIIGDDVQEYDMSSLGIIPDSGGNWTKERASFDCGMTSLANAYLTLQEESRANKNTDPVAGKCALLLRSYLGIR